MRAAERGGIFRTNALIVCAPVVPSMLYSCNRIRLLQRLKHATPTAKVLGWNPPKAATTRLRQEQGPWPWSGHETRPALVGSSPHGVDGQQPPGSPGVPQVPCRSKRTYASGLKCCLKQLCPGPALIIGCCPAEAGNLAPGASDETTPHGALHGTARNGPCAAPHPTMPHGTPIHYRTRQDTALQCCTTVRCTTLHYPSPPWAVSTCTQRYPRTPSEHSPSDSSLAPPSPHLLCKGRATRSKTCRHVGIWATKCPETACWEECSALLSSRLCVPLFLARVFCFRNVQRCPCSSLC